MKLFEKYKLGNLELKNRMVMPPMCMYQAENGEVNDFHIAHYTARAIGQVGLIIVEATGVMDNGRITDNCLGIWNDAQIEGHKKLVDSVHSQGSKIAIQLIHAGRKSETTGLDHYAPSNISFNDKEANFVEMSEKEIKETIEAFKQATERANKAGYDAVEIHAAHGYLINQFISPLSNKREDDFGKDRFLYLNKITKAIREVWPSDKPLWIRISATDFVEEGIKVEDWIEFLNSNEKMYDLVHVSAGGVVNAEINVYPGYMIEYAKRIKDETKYPTIGVGLLNEADLINYVLESNSCDLVACGRELLRNPNLLLQIAKDRKKEDLIFKSYKRAY